MQEVRNKIKEDYKSTETRILKIIQMVYLKLKEESY